MDSRLNKKKKPKLWGAEVNLALTHGSVIVLVEESGSQVRFVNAVKVVDLMHMPEPRAEFMAQEDSDEFDSVVTPEHASISYDEGGKACVISLPIPVRLVPVPSGGGSFRTIFKFQMREGLHVYYLDVVQHRWPHIYEQVLWA